MPRPVRERNGGPCDHRERPTVHYERRVCVSISRGPPCGHGAGSDELVYTSGVCPTRSRPCRQAPRKWVRRDGWTRVLSLIAIVAADRHGTCCAQSITSRDCDEGSDQG